MLLGRAQSGRLGGGNVVNNEYAEVNGVRLHYMTAGQGKLIMFLHGFPEFWYEWKKQLAHFSRDYQAVAPDMRGYNLSSKPADVAHYGLKVLVEDVRALADHLGHERFVLAGHDWGGVVAWGFAAAHPERLEKLIIINAPHPAVFDRELRQNPAQQQASQYMLVFRTPAAEQMLAAGNFFALDQALLEPGLQQGYFAAEDREAYLQAWAQPGALTGGLNYYRAAHAGPPAGPEQPPEELAAQLQALRIEVPTLVIWGERDPYLLAGNLDGLEQFVPELTVCRVPDGSHWVIHEKPELINSFIHKFMQGGAAVARSA
jgi:epoxide hydrolase 4